MKNKNLNMFTLIGLGVGVAYGYSVVAATLLDRSAAAAARPGALAPLTPLTRRPTPPAAAPGEGGPGRAAAVLAHDDRAGALYALPGHRTV